MRMLSMPPRRSVTKVAKTEPLAKACQVGGEHHSFGVLEANVRRCQDEGSLPADADAGVLSLLSWAEVHGLALLCNEGLIREMSEERGGSEKRTLDAIFAAIKGRLVPKR